MSARGQLGAALPEGERFVAAALHLPHEEQEHADHQDERRVLEQDQRPAGGRLALGVDDDALVLEVGVEAFAVLGRQVGVEALRGVTFVLAGDLVADEGDLLDLVGVHPLEKRGECDLLVARPQTGELPDQGRDDDQDHPEQEALQR